MKIARLITWAGVMEIGAVLGYGAGFYLGWWGPLPQQVLLVFALGVLMLTGGSSYAAGWHQAVEQQRVRHWRQTTTGSRIASLPAGAGPVDASLDTAPGRRPSALADRRVYDQCVYGGWLNPSPGRVRCVVVGCLHVATDPTGPSWEQTPGGGWLCPCTARHLNIGRHGTGAM